MNLTELLRYEAHYLENIILRLVVKLWAKKSNPVGFRILHQFLAILQVFRLFLKKMKIVGFSNETYISQPFFNRFR